MTTLEWLLVVLGLGLVTYAFRAGPILALADRDLPQIVVVALRNVGPAVLAALVVTLVADPDAVNSGVTVPEVAGLVAGALTAWRFKNMMITLAAGMIVFWLLLWLL